MKRVIFSVLTVILITACIIGAAAEGASETADYTDAAVLADLIESGDTDYILVDVRTPEEYASGYIPTAVNIPLSEIGSDPPGVEKDALIIVYCRSGNRSGQAKRILEDLGYSNVHNFGGIIDWPGKTVKP